MLVEAIPQPPNKAMKEKIRTPVDSYVNEIKDRRRGKIVYGNVNWME